MTAIKKDRIFNLWMGTILPLQTIPLLLYIAFGSVSAISSLTTLLLVGVWETQRLLYYQKGG
jgi:hypothetical protein